MKREGNLLFKPKREQEHLPFKAKNEKLLVYYNEPDSIFATKKDSVDRSRRTLLTDSRLRENKSVAPSFSHQNSMTQPQNEKWGKARISQQSFYNGKAQEIIPNGVTQRNYLTPQQLPSESNAEFLYHTFLNPSSNYFLGFDVHLRKRNNKAEQNSLVQQPPTYKFIIGRGNNSQLVREILSKKPNWVELTPEEFLAVKSQFTEKSNGAINSPFPKAGSVNGGRSNFASVVETQSQSNNMNAASMLQSANFIWQPVSNSICFDRVRSSLSHRICVNHVEKHNELSSKANLIKNLTRICSIEHLPIFEITPLTFIVNYASDNLNFERQFETFLATFLAHSKSESADTIAASILRSKNYYAGFSRRISGRLPVTTIPNSANPTSANTCLFSGLNLWIIKPADFNRGRGIRLFSTLVQLNKILQDYSEGSSVGNRSSKPLSQSFIQQQQVTPDTATAASNTTSSNNKITTPFNSKKQSIVTNTQNKGTESVASTSNVHALTTTQATFSGNMNALNSTFVIQKYIEKPMLVEQRKFDIRMWVMISVDSRYFVCREGYIRTACEAYSTSESSISNAVVHLTNNAIQKNANGYGKHEDGNQLSFPNFEVYLKRVGINCDFRGVVLPRIKEAIALSLDAVKAKLNPLDRKFCFEILGYDFMIDSSGQPWLIEVSTNPCIEQSSSMLDKLLKRMLDDAFKLTLDRLFPNHKGTSNQATETTAPPPSSTTQKASKQPMNKSLMENPLTYPVEGISNHEQIWEQLYLGHYQLLRNHRNR